jgi:hypothetical protein
MAPHVYQPLGPLQHRLADLYGGILDVDPYAGDQVLSPVQPSGHRL